MRKIILTIAAVAAVAAPVAAASAASAGTVASSNDWSANYINSGGQQEGGPQGVGAGSSAIVPLSSGNYITNVFTKQKADTGNLLGKTVSVTIDPTALQNIQGNPNGGDPSTASVRFVFEGASNNTGYVTQHWWSNPVNVDLHATQPQKISVLIGVDPSSLPDGGWSDYYGQPALGNDASFNQAASHVRDIGLSFGSGYFFENGVTADGSLSMTQFIVSP
jgi:hypothetical protein